MREKERSTRIIFVRHGETDFPLDRVYCDELEDPALNGLGVVQVHQTAEYLRRVRIDALYASPSARTKMTAEAIMARHVDLIAFYEDCLRERHFGVWEGLRFGEIERDFPLDYQEWKKNQAAFKPQGGESVYDLVDRVVPCVKDIVARHPSGVVVVVAHVGPIRALVSDALGMPVESYRQLCIDPASITMVDYGATQNNLVVLNFHARHWAA